MASISLPSSEYHAVFGGQLSNLTGIVLRHRYYLLSLLIALVAVGIVVSLQSSAASLHAHQAATTVSSVPVSNPVAPENIHTTPPPAVSSDSAAANSNTNKTEVTVNNHPIPVPANGTVNKTITNDDGKNVNVSIHSTTSGSGQTNSSTSLQVNTSSQTESITQEDSQ